MDVAYPLTGLLALLLAAVFFVAGWGYGRVLVRAPAGLAGAGPLVQIAIGTGLLGYLAFALGLIGWLRPGVLAVVLAGGLASAALVLARSSGPHVGSGLERRWFLARGLPRWSAVAGLIAVLLALLGAMLPEIEYDALWYHLTFPARYLRSGWLLDLPSEHMSPVPQHVELLYTYGLMFGDARGAKLIHFGFGLLAALWTGLLAARYVGRRWALPAAALFVTAPTVTWEMTTAYNELPLTLLAVGATALLLQWRERGERHLLVFAALLLGLGLAGKHLAYFFLVPLAAVVLLAPVSTGERRVARRFGDAALLCTLAVAVALPWYVRAWYYTGNPLFPMFYDVLTSAGLEIRRWDAQAQRGWGAAMDRYGHGRAPLDLLLLPGRMTWDGVRYAGSLGPAWLFFLPLLPLAWKRIALPLRLLAFIAGAYFLLWVTPYSSFQVRYLVPLVPLLSILVVAVIRELQVLLRHAGWRTLQGLPAALVIVVLFLNLPVFLPLADARVGWIPNTIHSIRPSAWATAVGLYDADRYTAARVRPYSAVQFMNAELASDARVVTFAQASHFYARAEMIHNYSRSVAAGTWGARRPGTEDEAYRSLRAAGVTHILWDKVRQDIDDDDFAVRSPAFRERYTRRVYEDALVELDELL